MKKAKVTFDYQPQEEDELALSIGEIISEVEPADTGWCKGLLNGKRGMFPDNFVTIFEEEEKKPASIKKKRLMKVLFPYKADNADEISLEVGDIIEIVNDVEEGWAEGVNRGKKGVFPTNFGEMIEGSSGSEESGDGGINEKVEEPEPKPSEDFATSSQKKVKGVGLGNIFADGPIKLRQRSIGESDKKKNLSTPPPAKTSTKEKEKEKPKEIELAKPKKAVDYCRVNFDYIRENEDELGLTKGEIIIVSNKNPGDDGWWEGQKLDSNGKKIKGVFPDNFVVELTPEEIREHEKQLQTKTESEILKETKAKTPNKESKKATPLVPAPPSQATKPSLSNDLIADDSTESAFSDPHTTEHTLTHVKRPGGPKNRRKPGAAERREKAAAVVEIVEQNGETTESEDERPAETRPEPAPKKDGAKRGVAVLPGLGGPSGKATTGEPPSWLQNLKNRQSTKRPPPAAPAPKETSPSEAAKPAWLANLKKRQSSEFPATATPVPKEKVALQPKPAADKPKPAAEKPDEKPTNGPAALIPPAKPAAAKPVAKPAPPSPTDKPLAAWQIERQQKARKSKTESNEDKAPEPPPNAASGEPAPTPASWKNSLTKGKTPAAIKSPTETHPPSAAMRKPDKPPIGTPVATPISGARSKPAPSRGKPAPPPAKPASASVVEELKTEIKNMKEEMEKMRNEMKNEILQLNSELQNERNHRISLEDEVRKLRQQLS
ncbi:uncharacterized protein LOC120338480 isoform X2 [Styela clava]